MVSDLKKWSTKILGFIDANPPPPNKDEAWRMGIPFEKIDSVLNYINIQIRTDILPHLSPLEREYFDQLSIKVIKYINQVQPKPALANLVTELGLSVKDAKLVIPYINEILGVEIKIEENR